MEARAGGIRDHRVAGIELGGGDEVLRRHACGGHEAGVDLVEAGAERPTRFQAEP
jgi:hypothetical protein